MAKAIDPALKARALKIAAERSPTLAAQETGFNASTIRAWRTRARPISTSRLPKTATRYLHGKEVVDAEHELRVFIEPEDVTAAVPSDPQQCAFAQACKRVYKSGEVLFLRSVAYVELPAQDGETRVERFIITPPVRRQIDLFDDTQKADPGGYLLRAPTPGCQLDKRRARQVYERKQRSAILKGELSGQLPRPQPPRRVPTKDVRRGIGMAQFLEHL